jgi:hypothetical protein
MHCLKSVKVSMEQQNLCLMKLGLFISYFTLIVRVSSSSMNQIGLNSESLSSSSELDIIDNDCTVVTIDLAAREEADHEEQNRKNRLFGNQLQLLEQNFNKPLVNILLRLNDSESDSNNFQRMKRPILQKATKYCFQTILNLPNSMETDHVHLSLNFLKENLIPINKDPFVIPNTDKLIILAGSRDILESTLNSSFGHSFKYKAGLIQGPGVLETNRYRNSFYASLQGWVTSHKNACQKF